MGLFEVVDLFFCVKVKDLYGFVIGTRDDIFVV